METPENGRKRPIIPEYDLRMGGFAIGGVYGPGSPDPDGLIHDVQLFEVSLVKNPANPACRVVSVSTPRGATRYDDLPRGDADQEC